MTATVFPEATSSFAPAVAHGLDLSPIVLRDVPTPNGGILRFREPLVLTPTQIEDSKYMSIQSDDLGIDVFAESRDELEEELLAEVRILWKVYASQEDHILTRDAIELKQKLLAAIYEVA